MAEIDSLKISIITINYNNLEGLKQTVESVLNQTYQTIEYIIIDGGSSDGSRSYIQENSSRIHYWESCSDRGIYHAMNKGIDKATGDYLLFLNSGDWLVDQGVIERAKKQINRKSDLIAGDLIKIFSDGSQVEEQMLDNLSLRSFLKNGLAHPVTFMNAELFRKYGNYDESYPIAADWVYFLMLFAKKNIRYQHVDFPISNYSMDGISSLKSSRDQILVERSSAKKKVLSTYQKAKIKWLARKDKSIRHMREFFQFKKIRP